MKVDPFLVATCRFGAGPRPGERSLGLGQADLLPGLLAQCAGPLPVPAAAAALPGSAEQVRQALAARDETSRARLAEARRSAFATEQAAWLAEAVAAEAAFADRWVAFWSNVFTVSIRRAEVAGLAGPLEREVLRPKVFGRFVDLLEAVETHPAMLSYLDQARSVGPRSEVGLRRERGLNENLAREILELHTLGVDGGYRQADVTALAMILTGWGLDPLTGRFRFDPRRHEPGTHRLLGRDYRSEGEDQGRQALRDLARRPATAHHLATRLVRWFIADDPDPGQVDRLARVFRETDGDLSAWARALLEDPASWETPLTKVRSPLELVIAAGRAVGGDPAGLSLLQEARWLGQLPYDAPSPKGWPERSEAWLSSASLLDRTEWAWSVAERAASRHGDVEAWWIDLYGEGDTRALRAATAGLDPRLKVATWLASPWMQRR